MYIVFRQEDSLLVCHKKKAYILDKDYYSNKHVLKVKICIRTHCMTT